LSHQLQSTLNSLRQYAQHPENSQCQLFRRITELYSLMRYAPAYLAASSCSNQLICLLWEPVVMIRMRLRDHLMELFPHLLKVIFCRRIRPQVPRSMDPHQLLYQSGVLWLLRGIIPTSPFHLVNRECIVISSHKLRSVLSGT
jgi:hypothetical protein